MQWFNNLKIGTRLGASFAFCRRSGPSHRLGSSLDLKSASGPTDARVVGAQRRFSNPTESVSRSIALVGFGYRAEGPSVSPPECWSGEPIDLGLESPG